MTLRRSASCWLLFRQRAAQPLSQLRHRAAHPDEKLSKRGILSANLIEAHFVDELLEHQRLGCKQIHAPLPIVEADGAGDNLLHLAGVAAADRAMLFHLPLPLLDGKGVPVLVFTTFTI